MTPRTIEQVIARIDATPVAGTAPEMRAAFARLAGPQPEGGQERLGGVEVRRFGSGRHRVVWLHGGGYVFGGAESHGSCAAALARAGGSEVLLPLYRLAPEHPWPAMADDALCVLDALDGPVAIIGDSAGAHLALTLALARPGRIAALGLISPNTDRTGQSLTRVCNSACDLMNDDAQDAMLAKMAFANLPPDAPALSPILADLSALPPTFLTASTTEVLLDDALLLARRLGLAGVPLDLHIRKGLFHMWTLWPDAIPEAADTIRRLARFVSRYL